MASPWEEAVWEEDTALVTEVAATVLAVAAAATASEGEAGSPLGLAMEVGSVWEAAAVTPLEEAVSPLGVGAEEAPA